MEEILTRRPEVFIPAPANGSLKEVCSPGEWETRVELAATFRLVNMYGLDDMANGAICARVKDNPDQNQHLEGVGDKDIFVVDGKASDYQIQSARYTQENQLSDKVEVPSLIKGASVVKAAGGLKFSLLWTEGNRLFTMGDNKFGQCGQNYILMPEVKRLKKIEKSGCKLDLKRSVEACF